MTRWQRLVRIGIIIAGAMLYLLAIAWLYGRPEVRLPLWSIAPLPSAWQSTEEAGCRQNQGNLSEAAIRKQLKQNRLQTQRGRQSDTEGRQ